MPTKKNNNNEVIILNGKEYNINERLPETFLKKDYSGIPYIPISTIREILRQLGVLKNIKFGAIQKTFETNNYITLTQKCIIELKDGTVLEGDGVISVSMKKLVGNASFGVLSNLKSRAVKTALVYYKTIFELPIEDEETVMEQVAEEASKKIKDSEIKQSQTKRDYPVELAEYLSKQDIKDEEQLKKLVVSWTTNNGATKSKVGEEVFKQLQAVVNEYKESLKSNK